MECGCRWRGTRKLSDQFGTRRASKGRADTDIIGNALERGPFDVGMSGDILDQAFQHQQDLRPARNIRVNGTGKDGIVHLASDPALPVTPHGRDIDEVDFRAMLQRMHPFLGGFGIVDGVPMVADLGKRGWKSR